MPHKKLMFIIGPNRHQVKFPPLVILRVVTRPVILLSHLVILSAAKDLRALRIRFACIEDNPPLILSAAKDLCAPYLRPPPPNLPSRPSSFPFIPPCHPKLPPCHPERSEGSLRTLSSSTATTLVERKYASAALPAALWLTRAPARLSLTCITPNLSA